ncbi:hypothetical protein ATN89_17065 [Comamonas thiooxydans]|nr:hypothetical protein ATN89_17065 [Comamonas thiooxydans]
MGRHEFIEVVPVEKVTATKVGAMMVYVDSWWICNQDGNPIFRNGRPLCNPHQQIAEKFLADRIGKPEYPMFAKIVLLPLAMWPLAEMGF